MSGRHVVVVGGGVIGVACAHYLSKAGWRVTVLDKSGIGAACSHANCGYVCPSHVLPLATPGALLFALGSMFKKDSAFRIAPRLSLSLARWLLAFARRCNTSDMLSSGRGIDALLKSSRSLYDELVASGIECEWKTRGLLFVFQSAHGMEHFTETNELTRKEFGVSARPFVGDAVNQLEPALKPGMGGGWLYECDAHLRPDRLMSSWRQKLSDVGVVFREQCAVQRVLGANGSATAVQTDQGEIAADAFVVASGALTPQVAKGLGCRTPIQPGKGYSITMSRPKNCPTIPLIFEEHRVAVTPFDSGYRIGSTMEFAGYDSSLNQKRLEYLKRAAAIYLDEPTAEPVQETWYGWRPMTPDSRPMIDLTPAFRNVAIAAGHNMLGLSMATGTGKLVSELLDGRAPHIDPAPFSARRF